MRPIRNLYASTNHRQISCASEVSRGAEGAALALLVFSPQPFRTEFFYCKNTFSQAKCIFHWHVCLFKVEGQPGEKAFDVQTLTCLASREVIHPSCTLFWRSRHPKTAELLRFSMRSRLCAVQRALFSTRFKQNRKKELVGRLTVSISSLHDGAISECHPVPP